MEPSGCFTKIAAGSSSACALRKDGALYCWGNNSLGQLGIVTTKIALTPTRVEALDGVLDVSLGGEFGCATTAAGLHCFGHNNFRQLGAGDGFVSQLPRLVEGLPAELRSFSAGGTHACAADTQGKLYCWGNNGWGELGLGSFAGDDASYTVRRPALVDLAGIAFVAAGEVHTCAAAAGVTLFCWGGHVVACGWAHACAAAEDGEVLCWGTLRVAVGTDFSCALTREGDVWCWGSQDFGQLGAVSGDPEDSPTPLRVPLECP